MQKAKSASILFALFPLLNIYATGIIPGISIGQCLLLIIFMCCIFLKDSKLNVYFGKYILYSIGITICCQVYSWTQWGDCLYEGLSLLVFFFLLNCAVKYLDYRMCKKAMYVIGVFSLVFFFLQYTLSFLGIRISGILPYFQLSNEEDTNTFIASQLNRDRFSSVFQEPAHYAEFMILILSFLLFTGRRTKMKIILSIIISTSILLSQSAGGYVLLLVSWSFWILTKFLKNIKYKSIYLIGVILFCIAAFWLIESNEAFVKVAERYKELSLTPEVTVNGYSSYIRVIRGYIPYIEGNSVDKIFGHGVGTLVSYVNSHPQSMFLSITDYNPNWVNSFQYILFTTGIIGVYFFFFPIMNIYKKRSLLGKVLTWQYVLTLLSSGILLTPMSAIFLYIIISESKECDIL